MQIAEPDHVLDAMYRGGVHGLDAALGQQPVLAAIVIADSYAPPFCRYHLGADGHVELVAGRRLDPYIITLKQMQLKSSRACDSRDFGFDFTLVTMTILKVYPSAVHLKNKRESLKTNQIKHPLQLLVL